jgi:hypothetical protein
MSAVALALRLKMVGLIRSRLQTAGLQTSANSVIHEGKSMGLNFKEKFKDDKYCLLKKSKVTVGLTGT